MALGRKGRRSRMVTMLAAAAVLAAAVFCTQWVSAQEQPSEGPPLPLHTIEGVGGLVLTPTAYLVNPGPPGTVVGKPAFATQFALIGDKDFEALSFTWTLWERLELGYAFNRFGLDDFDDDVFAATGIDITDEIYLHHFLSLIHI